METTVVETMLTVDGDGEGGGSKDDIDEGEAKRADDESTRARRVYR